MNDKADARKAKEIFVSEFQSCGSKKKPQISQMTPIFICEIDNLLSHYQINQQIVVPMNAELNK